MSAVVKRYVPSETDLRVSLLLVDHAGLILHADPMIHAVLGRNASQCEGRSLDEVIPSVELLMLMREVSLGVVQRGTLTVPISTPVRRLALCLTSVRRLRAQPMVAIQVALEDDQRGERDVRATNRMRSAIESVIAGFAHEVRNPIAAILSLTEAALCEATEEQSTEALLRRIPGLVNRVDKLIKESLSYSRPRSPKRAPLCLGALLDWSIQLARMERSGIDFEVSIDERLGSVLVDAEQIEQVVVNLLCNAREAATSRVTLRARREADPAGGDPPARVVLEVADDGAGVQTELHERIFEPFFTTKAQGTGLGLAIARDLARLNGGEVELYESSPRGTTFVLYLVEADGPRAIGDALS